MPRSTSEWVGKNDDAMPTIHVLLRLYTKQNGLCGCGCGTVMNMNRDEIDCDHTLALADGGENREGNLTLMLRQHHRDKTSEENVARGRVRRQKAKAFTAKRKSKSRPFPGGKNSRWKRSVDGTVSDRITGEVL